MVTCLALMAVIDKVEVLPGAIEAGVAAIATVGGGLGVTVTVALAEAFRPYPAAVAV